MNEPKEQDISKVVKGILDEAREFAEGNSNHFYYTKENGPYLRISHTKDIINNLINRVKGLLDNDEVRKEIEHIYFTFGINCIITGKHKYLVKDKATQIYGQQMCGG